MYAMCICQPSQLTLHAYQIAAAERSYTIFHVCRLHSFFLISIGRTNIFSHVRTRHIALTDVAYTVGCVCEKMQMHYENI